ncbi:MAG: hypothetical protein IKE95_08295 [Methanobrevibacter sp.]|nr:hypothetical protein [Methanobrevibacter sp.]
MLTIKTKNSYSRREILFLLDIMISMLETVKYESKCNDCRTCKYHALCKDLTNTVHYLKTL